MSKLTGILAVLGISIAFLVILALVLRQHPPDRPMLYSPIDGVITNDNTPTFEWTPGANADHHRLLVDNDLGFTSPIENILLGAIDNTYTVTTSLVDENYSWKVIAINAAGENSSSVWTFLVDTVAPTSNVDAISPYWRNTSPITITVTASDTASGLARAALWCRYSSDNSTWGSWTWFDNDNVSPWSWSFNFPSGNGYYEFYSTARDNVGNEEAAPTIRDTMCGFDNVSPAAPTLVRPAGGENINDDTPTLDWNPVSDNSTPVLYRCYVDNNSNFSSIEHDSGWISATEYTTPTLAEGIWYWRVQAKDNAGNVGDNSAARSFRVDVTPPSKPALGLPDNNATSYVLTVTFGWGAVTDISMPVTYDIQIDNEASFASPMHENTGLTENSYTYTFAVNENYYWRVRARDKVGNASKWADNFKLTINVPPPPPSVMLSVSAAENSIDNTRIVLTLSHLGGDTINTADVTVEAQDKDNNWVTVIMDWSATFSVGETCNGGYIYGEPSKGNTIWVKIKHNPSGLLLYYSDVLVT